MTIDQELELVRAHLRAVVEAGPPARDCAEAGDATAAIAWLCERLALSSSEQRVLWLLAAHELCPETRELIRELNTEDVADPTVDAIRRAIYGAPSARAWNELGEDGSLRWFGLVERTDGVDAAPAHRQTLAVARRVLALVHGDHSLDPEVLDFASAFVAPPLVTLCVDRDAACRADAAIARGDGLVLLGGRAGSGRRSLLAALARAHGHSVLAVDVRLLAARPDAGRGRDPAERRLRLVARECALFGHVPLLLHLDALAGDTSDRLALVEQELGGLVLATTSTPLARRWNQAPSAIELPNLAGAQRAELWARAVPDASPADADLLATMYPLTPALIHAVGTVAVARCASEPMQPRHVEAAVRDILDDRLAGLAARVEVTQTWDDLVLPDDQTMSVIEMLARIRKRRRVYEDWGFAAKVGKGLGVSALFSGPPGTGKTMCAGLIARDLGTELYQVDVSKIVSKWIGESQKNLAALFDAAEAGHAILLFDEADALFGKRTEVKSSNDRHANQEVNYLLQRLESFAGICILTTNHTASIDEAFRRRLSVHIQFPLPDVEERRRLWHALLPRTAPTHGELGLDRLADKFEMSGGYIRNAVLRAAFLAADQDAPITNDHLVHAAQLEYEAMGKIVTSRAH